MKPRNFGIQGFFQSTSRFIVVLMFCLAGNAFAFETSVIEKQFVRLDSTLARCANLPQTRMKEIAPFNEVMSLIFKSNPAVSCIRRTSSKGAIVNCGRQNDSDSEHVLDASEMPWFTTPKKTMAPYHGPLFFEKGKWNAIWSRPLSIMMPEGKGRFAGIVEFTIDFSGVFSRVASQEKQFQILCDDKPCFSSTVRPLKGFDESEFHVPGDQRFVVRFALPPSPTRAIVAEVKADSEIVSSTAARNDKRKHGPMLLQIAGCIAILIVAGLLLLIISTMRSMKKKAVVSSENQDNLQNPFLETGSDYEIVEEELSNSSLAADGATQEDARPSYAEIPQLQTPEIHEIARQSGDEHEDQPPGTSMGPITEVAVAQSEMPEPVSETAETAMIGEDAIAKKQVLSEIAERFRGTITDEMREQIYTAEVDALKKAIRQQVLEKEMDSLIETARKAVATEARRHIVETMGPALE